MCYSRLRVAMMSKSFTNIVPKLSKGSKIRLVTQKYPILRNQTQVKSLRNPPNNLRIQKMETIS